MLKKTIMSAVLGFSLALGGSLSACEMEKSDTKAEIKQSAPKVKTAKLKSKTQTKVADKKAVIEKDAKL